MGGRRGTASTLHNLFTSSQQSIGNVNNIKRSSGGSVDNSVNNNNGLGSANNINNNGRLSTGSVKIELDERFIKDPSFGANEKRNTMSKMRITKNNIDQGSSCDSLKLSNNSKTDKTGTVGKSNNTQIGKRWSLDLKLSDGSSLLPQSSSWTSSQIPSKSPWWKIRQETSAAILTTLKHSETKSRQETSAHILTTSKHSETKNRPTSVEFSRNSTVTVPKIRISNSPSTESEQHHPEE